MHFLASGIDKTAPGNITRIIEATVKGDLRVIGEWGESHARGGLGQREEGTSEAEWTLKSTRRNTST